MSTYLAPLLVFGLVVFVHELGHFLAAKLTGVYAPVFSLGWGSRLFGIRRGETDYRVSWFPIGGFVRMATREDDSMAGIEGGRDRGELEGEQVAPQVPSALWDENSMAPFGPKAVPENRWVESKSTLQRVFILSSGVLMNIILAVVVSSSVVYKYGEPYRPAIVDSVVTGMPAAEAGLQHGDEIVGVNGVKLNGWNDVVDHIAPVTTGPLTLDIRRGTEQFSRAVTPRVDDVLDSLTNTTKKVARVGIKVNVDTLLRTHVGLRDAAVGGARATWFMAGNVASTLGTLLHGKNFNNLGGPIQIARVSVQAAKSGGEMLWSLIAFISLNIAMLNLVPIPVLDGGQILLVLAERIKGSAFSANVRENFARVGIFAVLGLFVLVMFNDVKAWIVN